MKSKIGIIIELIIVLLISNIFWVIAYGNGESDYSMIFATIASFVPMIFTLIVTKIKKEGWNNLGIRFSFKKGWKMYVFAIVGTLFTVYATQFMMYLIFRDKVESTFTIAGLGQIGMMTVFGIACFIEMLGEELGWIGYFFPKLEKMSGTLSACLLLGLIRGIYHLGIIFYMEHPVVVFVEITISNIVMTPFMIYMFRRSESIFPCTISHGMANLLPIFISYNNDWYYGNPLAIIVGMIPSLILSLYSLYAMKKKGFLIGCNRRESN